PSLHFSAACKYPTLQPTASAMSLSVSSSSISPCLTLFPMKARWGFVSDRLLINDRTETVTRLLLPLPLFATIFVSPLLPGAGRVARGSAPTRPLLQSGGFRIERCRIPLLILREFLELRPVG